MIVIVCLDESGGMLFNRRRQSRDRAVSERIGQICRGKKLWMNGYSRKLYGDLEGARVLADEAFLSKAKEGEFCLVETERLAPFADRIEGMIVFRWNRRYPADFYLDLDLAKWRKLRTQDYTGFSHEIITEEFYVKGAEEA